MNPLTHWSNSLPMWAIPAEIMTVAPESPWIHPVSQFVPDRNIHSETPSLRCAREALPREGSVLDIGCGGGRAAFGLVPPAHLVVGVDHQQGMLDVFSDQAHNRGVACETVLGDWPEVSTSTPVCDVVTCHHVIYNVADLAPFIHALSQHARHRVVIECPQQHPLSSLTPFWKKFWNIDRPQSPTAQDALAAIRHVGYDAQMELWAQDIPSRDITDDDVRFTRIRLCLSSDKDPQIREFMSDNRVTERQLATIWWDV